MENGIVRVKIENFKKIENLETVLDGRSVFLVGDNEVGKSTFLQAVFGTIANENFATHPITEGKDKAEIEVEFMVGGKKYTAYKKFTEKNLKGYFEVKSEDGMTSTNKGFMEQLVGDISFNPFSFVNLGDTVPGMRKQVEIIRGFLSDEDNDYIDTLDESLDVLREERKIVNKNIVNDTTLIRSFEKEFKGEKDIDIYEEKIDVRQLVVEINEIKDSNYKIRDAMGLHERSINREGELHREIELLREQIADTKKIIEDGEIESVENLENKLSNSSDHNALCDSLLSMNNLKNRVNRSESKQKSLESKIEVKVEEREKLIEDSKLPINGLTWDKEGIKLNGLPLDQDQLSTSEIMFDIGVKLAMARNPKLKILKIPRGESLGSARIKDLKSIVKNKGYQVFVEKVDSSVAELKIQFFE